MELQKCDFSWGGVKQLIISGFQSGLHTLLGFWEQELISLYSEVGEHVELLPLELAEPLSSVTLVATCQVIAKNTLGLKHLDLN